MARLSIVIALVIAAALNTCTNAFTTRSVQTRAFTPLRMVEDTETEVFTPPTPAPKPVERGVSIDQDGKSNVWAIEPKMEVSTKSSEEKGATALIAGGGFAAFAVLAGLILTNLPDPDQF